MNPLNNVSTFNSLMNSSENDFNYSYTIADAVDWAEFVEMVNEDDTIYQEDE